MSANDFLLDFALASGFILIGQFLRAKVSILQKLFVPASMIAGFIALALGKQGFDIIPFSGSIGDYAGMLIIVIFSAVGINGFSFNKAGLKDELTRVGSYFSYKILAQNIQFALAPLFSILVISKLFPEINYGFGFLLASGFSGGHGTAAAIGSAMESLGFADATDIAMTCATVGILSGIFGGLFFIKIGTKRGWTKYIKDFQSISGDLRTGLISTENRQSMGKEITAGVALDSLAWHFALLLFASGAGMLINSKIIAPYVGIDLPTYLIAFLFALCMFIFMRKTGTYKYVDKNTVEHVSGTMTDYLVFFGIASIKIPVIVKYAVPLTMLLLFGIVLVVVTLLFFGPAMNKGSWFERSLFVYGYSTGVFAIGFVLLRIVDPENRSETLNDTAFAAPLTMPAEMFGWGAAPSMLLLGQHWAFIGINSAILIASIVLCLAMKWWWLKLPLDRPAVNED